MTFYGILQHLHSGLRWLVLIALIVAIIASINQWNKSSQDGTQLRWANIAVRLTHLQLLIGLILYFISPMVQFSGNVMKNTVLRFYTVEHITLMVIAIILITIGYSKAKKKALTSKKAKTIFWYFLIGLILILISIPWPFREALGGGWG